MKRLLPSNSSGRLILELPLSGAKAMEFSEYLQGEDMQLGGLRLSIRGGLSFLMEPLFTTSWSGIKAVDHGSGVIVMAGFAISGEAESSRT